jgi:hypothetical protein
VSPSQLASSVPELKKNRKNRQILEIPQRKIQLGISHM